MMKFYNVHSILLACFYISVGMVRGEDTASIPLPVHPRPDFERPEWLNLTGPREFRFDPDDRVALFLGLAAFYRGR